MLIVGEGATNTSPPPPEGVSDSAPRAGFSARGPRETNTKEKEGFGPKPEDPEESYTHPLGQSTARRAAQRIVPNNHFHIFLIQEIIPICKKHIKHIGPNLSQQNFKYQLNNIQFKWKKVPHLFKKQRSYMVTSPMSLKVIVCTKRSYLQLGNAVVCDCFVDESNAMSPESASAMKSPYMEM